ncbi:hypothetical protein AVL62_03040 [Serinicoccus chungangensis]|uniref:Cell wall-binding repeat 2 family protein n=1 Tax=Serinicoccus chungangensis TaxID=767452 RepID=A0A0W8I678_9MICO|nr:hypothetical protein [Serinicoccus chungangensis]KUG53754.1 hypothetical protein AVL62_03040 [Serinicoccus chungangensis]
MSDHHTRARRRWAALTASAVVLAACTPGADSPGGAGDGSGTTAGSGGSGAEGTDSSSGALVAVPATGQETMVLGGATAAELSVQASRAFFESAPVVVVAAQDEQLTAASAGVALGAPVLVDGPGVVEEVERLGAGTALTIGPVEDPGVDVLAVEDGPGLAEVLGADAGGEPVPDGEQVSALLGLDPDGGSVLQGPAEEASADAGADAAAQTSGDPGGQTAAPAEPLESDVEELPETARPEPVGGTTVLSTGGDRDAAAVASALAAGAPVLVAPEADPRASSEVVQAVAAAEPGAVVGIGPEFGDAETLTSTARAAATGVELPGGGQLVLPGKTYVALYGNPTTSSLGVLGEQGPEETVARAEEIAGAYTDLVDEPVVPALEIIATVASSDPGPDGNYSNEMDVETLRPLVDLAAEHGMYVVLDLQPGRTDFVTQAELYEELLVQPHVGLALDPEWRLGPSEVHLQQIGQVDVAEVDAVVDWLAELTRDHDLPQKMLVLHQFQTRMIPGVDEVDQSRPEVAVLIHADGQGAQEDKQGTWRSLHDYAPSVTHWGWKNFYDEDLPGPLSPAETMQVEPTPDFISYQ